MKSFFIVKAIFLCGDSQRKARYFNTAFTLETIPLCSSSGTEYVEVNVTAQPVLSFVENEPLKRTALASNSVASTNT